MKKNRIMAGLLATVMAVSTLLTGCGGEDNSSTAGAGSTTEDASAAEDGAANADTENADADSTAANTEGMTTIKILHKGPKPDGWDAVYEEYLNRTQDTLGIALDINWIEHSDYQEKLNLEITSGGDWDLVFDASWVQLKNLAPEGYYADLSSYFNNPEYPGLQKAFTPEVMEANKWFGSMCYIPLFETYGNGIPCIWYRKDWARDWGVGTDGQINSYDELEAYWQAAKDNGVIPYKDNITDRWEEMGAVGVHYFLSERMRILEDAYGIMRQDIRLIQHKHGNFKKIGIALDEYNPWYRSDENVFCPYHVGDGLLVGNYFNIFIRNADVAVLSNMAQLVNVLPAMVCRPGAADFYRTAVSYVQELFLPNAGLDAVDTWTAGETWKGQYYSETPYLDVSASYDREKNRLVLNIVNRHVEKALQAKLEVVGKTPAEMTGRLVGNQKIDLANTFENPEAVCIRTYEPDGELPMITAPPLSVNVLEIKLR